MDPDYIKWELKHEVNGEGKDRKIKVWAERNKVKMASIEGTIREVGGEKVLALRNDGIKLPSNFLQTIEFKKRFENLELCPALGAYLEDIMKKEGISFLGPSLDLPLKDKKEVVFSLVAFLPLDEKKDFLFIPRSNLSRKGIIKLLDKLRESPIKNGKNIMRKKPFGPPLPPHRR
ncbi:MAG: hypothetical protein ABID38_00625 [Candidatus Diapherotrites archaeon]